VFNRIFAELAAQAGEPDRLMIDALPKAKLLLGDKGYDADRFRQAQGLAPHPHPLRAMRLHLHVSHRSRSHRNLLALINET